LISIQIEFMYGDMNIKQRLVTVVGVERVVVVRSVEFQDANGQEHATLIDVKVMPRPRHRVDVIDVNVG